MKQLFRTLLLLLLVLSMLVSCGGTPPPTPDDDDGDEDDDGTTSVYDPSQPITDPSAGMVIGSVSPAGAEFVSQAGTHLGNMITNASGSVDDVRIPSYLPSAEEIIAQGRADFALYGVYGWSQEHVQYGDDIQDIGWSVVRGTGSTKADYSNGGTNTINDEAMFVFCEAGLNVMCTMGIMLASGSTYNVVNGPDGTYYQAGYFTTTEEPGAGTNKTLQQQLRDYFDADHYLFADWALANIDAALHLLKRYGPDGEFWDAYPEVPYHPITHVEVFNEPNFQYMLPLKTDTGADDANHIVKTKAYCLLQICMYHAIKEAYGDAVKIVGFGAGGQGMLDTHFIKAAFGLTGNEAMTALLNEVIAGSPELQEAMGLESGEQVVFDVPGTLDIISTHPYFGPSPFAATTSGESIAYNLRDIRTALANKALTEEDKVKPIWYTECGYQLKGRGNVKEDMDKGSSAYYAQYYTEDFVYNPDDWGFVKYGSSTPTTGDNQITQAAMLVQTYVFGLRCGIGAITYMHLQDTDGCNYGLFNFISSGAGDMAWRKSTYAIQVMTHLMPNPLLKEVIHEGQDPLTGNFYYAYTFESDVGGEDVTVAFTPRLACEIKIPWEDEYALVTDLLGTTKIVAAENGYIVLDGGACMMYVRHVDNATLIEHGYVPATPTAFVAWVEKKDEQ